MHFVDFDCKSLSNGFFGWSFVQKSKIISRRKIPMAQFGIRTSLTDLTT